MDKMIKNNHLNHEYLEDLLFYASENFDEVDQFFDSYMAKVWPVTHLKRGYFLKLESSLKKKIKERAKENGVSVIKYTSYLLNTLYKQK